jgi:peptidoglycan hydrolase-like protein with peptidoglycan-binding domain
LCAASLPSLAAWPQAQSAAPAKQSPAPAKSKSAKSAKKRAHRPRPQKAPTPDRIKDIQGALAQAGFYHGEPTGKWDVASVQAMKQFQQANGLPPSGKLDALSLQKLRLGSSVAGAAAPRAPSNGTRFPQSRPR